jgi:hypothetical protein
MAAFVTALRGFLEPLGGGPVGFEFRHFATPFILKIKPPQAPP